METLLPPAVTATVRQQLPLAAFDLYGRLSDLPLADLSIVDYGAGLRTSAISQNVRLLECRRLVSVEIHPEHTWYLQAQYVKAKTHDVWQMDMCQWARVQPDKSHDVALLLDVIEHLTMDDALAFLQEVERITRRRILIWLPIGPCPQGPKDGNPHELHQSTWTVGNLTGLGYTVQLFPAFHTHIFPDRGVDAAWATKDLPPQESA